CVARYKKKWARAEVGPAGTRHHCITNLFGSRVIEILFIDFGVSATIEVTELREVPVSLFGVFHVIPPQAIKCRLAELMVPEGDWNPKLILWLKQAFQSTVDCKMKILKLDQDKKDRLVHMYLFLGDSQEVDQSINHQLLQSDLWQNLSAQNSLSITSSLDLISLSSLVEKMSLSNPVIKPLPWPHHGASDSLPEKKQLLMPPRLDLPQPSQNVDVFVPVACHPSYFVLQPWKEQHK
ncbi:hypothetical protein LDENG_00210320, partial [Lucifuga dentata]